MQVNLNSNTEITTIFDPACDASLGAPTCTCTGKGYDHLTNEECDQLAVQAGQPASQLVKNDFFNPWYCYRMGAASGGAYIFNDVVNPILAEYGAVDRYPACKSNVGCDSPNARLITVTTYYVIPYDEHAAAYGALRYAENRSIAQTDQVDTLATGTTQIILCDSEMSYTDRILIAAPSPPPPEPPMPLPPQDTQPPSPPYVFTTAWTFPGAVLSTAVFFGLGCFVCAFHRRAGGQRNKMSGTGQNAVFKPSTRPERRLKDNREHNGAFRRWGGHSKTTDTEEAQSLYAPLRGAAVSDKRFRR
jgi:hypothetical protein